MESVVMFGVIAVPVVADGSSAPYVSNGTCLGITGTVSASNYWWKQSYSNAQWVNTSIIPGNTPIDDLKLQFECFVKEVFTGPVSKSQCVKTLMLH